MNGRAKTSNNQSARTQQKFSLLVLLATLVAFPAHAQDRLQQAVDVPAVTVEVTWVESEAQMRRLRAEYGRAPVDGVIRTELTGFSVLGRRDGQFVCLVFAYKPERFDDRGTTTLGHELLHCLGFSHQ